MREGKLFVKPQVGMIGIGDIEVKEQKIDYETIINKIKDLDVELISGGVKTKKEEIEVFFKKLLRKNLDVFLIVVLRGMSAQIIKTVVEAANCPCIIWAVRRRWAWPSSILALGYLKEKEKKVKLIYEFGDDSDTLNEFRKSLYAAFTLSRLRQTRIGKIGSLFPNLVSCNYDELIIKHRLGVELIEISFNELRDTIATVSKNNNIIEKLKVKIFDMFTVTTTEKILAPGIKLHLALKSIAGDHDLDGFAIECWSKMPKEIGLNPCLGFIEDDYILGCEGDVLLCITLIMVRYLTGINAYAGDLYDLNKENILTLVHCGAPASLSVDRKSTLIYESIQSRKQGFNTAVCCPQILKGPVTILRFYGKGCDRIHLTTGKLIKTEQNEKVCGVKIRLSGDGKRFSEECLANHYVVVPVNIQEELELLCQWLKISLIRV